MSFISKHIIGAPYCTPLNQYIVIIVIGEILWKILTAKYIKNNIEDDDPVGGITSWMALD